MNGHPGACVHGKINGFDIVTRDEDTITIKAYLRGNATYAFHYNFDTPLGTLMSIERTLQGLETVQSRLDSDIGREEKALTEYKLQSEKPFEHEERLKELLAEQTRLNASLDLDKDDKQATTADNDDEEITYIDAASVISADVPMRGENDNEALKPTGTAVLTS